MTAEARALEAGRGMQTPYERDASIAQVFVARAAAVPGAVAVDDGSRTLSYGELDRRSNRLARVLGSLGAGPGQCVGVAFERSIELPVVLLGILKAGAAYVALDMASPRERLAFVVRDASLALVIVDDASLDPARFGGAQVVSLAQCEARMAAESCELVPPLGGPEALAYVAYTSGSTGRPKGVKVVHRGVVRLVRGADYVAIAADDVFLHFAPLAFDASTFELWAPLLNGARLAVAPARPLSLQELGAVLARFGVTVLWLTAPLFAVMVKGQLESLAGVRQLLTGGDVVSPQAAMRFVEAFPHCRLIDGYGPTENTTFSCCYSVPSGEAIRAGVPIGRPIAHSTAYVVDERMQLAETGTPGELCVGGDGLASGYLNLPELTAERFVADPFSAEPGARLYRTGDVARLRSDGNLEYLGRLDDQVKVRGFRIELSEIEHALRAHPAITDAALSVVTYGEERALFAHVVRSGERPIDERAVREHLRTTLPPHMIPAKVGFIDAMPLATSGKLDRMELGRRAAAAQSEPRSQETGRGALPASLVRGARMRAIAACWQEVLGTTHPPDPDENFFDAGGDSLRLLTLHDRLRRELQVDVGIVDLFEHCTVRKLAAFVNDRVA